MTTFLGAHGISIELESGFEQVPEEEVDPVCLAVRVAGWGPEFFCPTIVVTAEPLRPDRATMSQLSMLTIAGQTAMGRQVIGCEAVDGPGGTPARVIVSTFPAVSTTVVVHQWVGILGGRAVTVTAQSGFDRLLGTRSRLDGAVSSLRWDFDDPPVAPDPAAMPRLDPDAGAGRESLEGVRASQTRWAPGGPPLSRDEQDSLRRGKLRRRVAGEGLRAAGLIDDDRRLTELGRFAHEVLRSPLVQLSGELRRGKDVPAEMITIRMHWERSVAAWSDGERQALSVVATGTLIDLLLRWIGLAPVWPASAPRADFPLEALNRRVLDSHEPAPSVDDAALSRVWAQPWDEVRLASNQKGTRPMRLIVTPDAGPFLVAGSKAGSPRDICLFAASPAIYIKLLAGFLGYEDL